jgi:beta-galactosidase
MLIPDRTEISADGADLSYIKVEIVDKEGYICPNADNLVKFEIAGEGIIAGVGNGNPISHEYFKSNERKTFHGLALAVIRSTDKAGEIKLTATSDGLKESGIVIRTKN